MRTPDSTGHVERDGVRIYYGVFGDGPVTVLLLPTWALGHSKVYRANVDYLARHFRVIAPDPRGNGRSDRPAGPDHYSVEQYMLDALAILDATGTGKAVLVSYSWGARVALRLCALHAERIHCAVFTAPTLPMFDDAEAALPPFQAAAAASPSGWDKFNASYWKADWEGFVSWFIDTVNSDPHSLKGSELGVDWALETDAETMIDTVLGDRSTQEETRRLCSMVKAPCLIVSPQDDKVVDPREAAAFAEAVHGHLVAAEGCGHAVHARYAVWFNTLLKEFIDKTTPYHPAKFPVRTTWKRAMTREKRVLYLSSPIGLGHARRDAAIAGCLRELVGGLEVDWLTQSPVDRILTPRGEKLLPESRHLLSEIDLFDAQTTDHCQPIFPIARNMDTIMVNNFHVFMEVMAARQYDLVIADEGWEVDHFLHEFPEYKRAGLVWTTDVVGHLPTAQGGEPFDPAAPRALDRAYEERAAADWNLEMISRMERFPQVRDLSIYIGDQQDIPHASLGPGLPTIREHVDRFYRYGGYVLGFDPAAELADRAGIRAELGYRPDEKICIVAVGGMAAGQNLLRKAIAAFPAAKREVPELRMIVVAGPRIDPRSLHDGGALPRGLEVVGFVHNLYRNMAVCDLAIVHGGLTQTMDLTAAGVPFLVVPYLRQFEQEVWVRHRLSNYGATSYLDYRDLRTEAGIHLLATAMVKELRRTEPPRYRAVEDNAMAVARLIRPLL